MKKQKINFTIIVVILSCITIFSILLICHFFFGYRSSIVSESSDHLVEINAQIGLFVESEIKNDWDTLDSMANLVSSTDSVGYDNVKEYLRKEKAERGIDQILFYTESGYCVNLDGVVKQNDTASEILTKLEKEGRVMTILQSSLSYTRSLETSLMINDSKVIAVAIAKNIDSFLDHMEIESFNNTALLYLVKGDGQVVAHNQNSKDSNVFNVLGLFENQITKQIAGNEKTIAQAIASNESEVYICGTGNNQKYVVIMPIDVEILETVSMVYIVNERIVNNSMNTFSFSIIVISVVCSILFVGVIAFIFIQFYQFRRKEYNNQIADRDHIFQLLIDNTKYAFSLLVLGETKPLFTSSNMETYIDDNYTIEKCDGVFKLVGENTDANYVIDEINKYLVTWNGEEELTTDYISYFLNKKEKYLQFKIYPISAQIGKYITIVNDTTYEREHEKVIRDALQMADNANVAKTRFLANISHDIRTPMNAIINMTKFAMNDLDNPVRQSDNLNTILTSAEHLLLLMNDILDMSKVESGEINISNEPFKLDTTLNEIVEIIKPLCEEHIQTFTYDFSGLEDTSFVGDKLKLTQVLINLLNNAVKYTHNEGQISFNVYTVKAITPNEYETVRFVVKDNGIGIAKKNLEKIFEPFNRSDNELVSHIEGTGLGLAICKSFITAMGGSIVCESSIGEGSTFTVEIIMKKMNINNYEKQKEIEVEKEKISFIGKKALLCEDNLVNQKIAIRILTSFGLSVDVANNGEEGIKKYTENHDYDIIFMDIMMPILDGYEATTVIRNSNLADSLTIPIVAMTANVFSNDIEKSRIVGMNAHIGKPIDINELGKVIKILLTEEE